MTANTTSQQRENEEATARRMKRRRRYSYEDAPSLFYHIKIKKLFVKSRHCIVYRILFDLLSSSVFSPYTVGGRD
jgi:hypothetical protein